MKNINLAPFKKFFSYGDRIHPARDWFVLLVTAGILLVCTLIWNIYLFTELENGVAIGSATSAPPVTIGESISQVQDIFKTRATEENLYQNTYHFVDPSLPSS